MKKFIKQFNFRYNDMSCRVVGKYLPVFHIVEYPKCGGTWLMRILRSCYNQKTNEGRELLLTMGHRFYKRHYLPNRSIHKPILVVRDPRDVWISFYFHVVHLHQNEDVRDALSFSSTTEDAILVERFIKLYLEHPERFYPFFTYEQFIKSWMAATSNKAFFVKYEDLQNDAYAVLNRVCNMYDFDIPSDLMRNAIEANSFSRLSNRNKGVMDSKSHKRKGIVGDWKNYFSDELLEYVYSKQTYLFNALNYIKDTEGTSVTTK